MLSKNLNYVVSNKKKFNNLKENTDNLVYLAPLPFYFYSKNILTEKIIIDKKDKLLVMPSKLVNFANILMKTSMWVPKVISCFISFTYIMHCPADFANVMDDVCQNWSFFGKIHYTSKLIFENSFNSHFPFVSSRTLFVLVFQHYS